MQLATSHSDHSFMQNREVLRQNWAKKISFVDPSPEPSQDHSLRQDSDILSVEISNSFI